MSGVTCVSNPASVTGGSRNNDRTASGFATVAPLASNAPNRSSCSWSRETAVFGPIPDTPSLKSVPQRIAASISCSRVRSWRVSVASNCINSGLPDPVNCRSVRGPPNNNTS
jgi:hypothetical protein